MCRLLFSSFLVPVPVVVFIVRRILSSLFRVPAPQERAGRDGRSDDAHGAAGSSLEAHQDLDSEKSSTYLVNGKLRRLNPSMQSIAGRVLFQYFGDPVAGQGEGVGGASSLVAGAAGATCGGGSGLQAWIA